ncbi:MAG: hypothetical protein QF733_05980 [Phycisphaerales bacterium]|nr:hypothetical protein [Phycisphaerales bacterium]
MPSIACPWCGHDTDAADARFIAASPTLAGDPVLGAAAQLRFLPCNFDAGARPLDPAGAPSTRPACPACRVEWPTPIWYARGYGIVQVPDCQTAQALLTGASTALHQAGWNLHDITPEGLRSALSADAASPRIGSLQLERADERWVILLAVDPPAIGPDVVVADEPEPPASGVVRVVRSSTSDRPIAAPADLQDAMPITAGDFEHPAGWPPRCVRVAADGRGDAMTLLLAATARTSSDA